MRLFGRLFRLIWGSDVEPALRPLLAVSFVGTACFSAGWSFIGIRAIEELGASSGQLGVTYLIALTFVGHDVLVVGAYAATEPPTRGSFAVIRRDHAFLLFLVSAGLQLRGAYGDDAAWFLFAAVSVVAAATGLAAVRGASRRRVTPATVGY